MTQINRPEDIQILPFSSKGEIGEILYRTYLGSHYRYFVKVQEYDELIEITHSEKLEVGIFVSIRIPKEKCGVLL